MPGHGRDTGLAGNAFRLNLVAHRPNCLWSRTDESDTLICEGLCEFRVFRKKPVTRMHGICRELSGCLHDCFDVQIGSGCFGRSDEDGLVCQGDVQCPLVGLRIDR